MGITDIGTIQEAIDKPPHRMIERAIALQVVAFGTASVRKRIMNAEWTVLAVFAGSGSRI